jgi:hypothetical protein
MNAPLLYPHYPGSRGVPTSDEAAEAIAPRIGRLQSLVFAAITKAGDGGLTADEVADTLQMDRWSVQPRTTELRLRDLIEDSGQRRRNRTGKRAIVWTATGRKQ